LRDEAWRPHIADLLLPARQVVVTLPFAGGEALLRYREELSMYAALHDERAAAEIEAGVRAAAMLDAAFLDARAAAMTDEWPRGSVTMRGWWAALEGVRAAVDAAIAELGGDAAARGVFVKLSVRSPKDAAVCVPAFRRELDAWMAATDVAPDSPLALSDTVCAIKRASWLALRCHSGAEVVQVRRKCAHFLFYFI
jgi:hypothetical protein